MAEYEGDLLSRKFRTWLPDDIPVVEDTHGILDLSLEEIYGVFKLPWYTHPEDNIDELITALQHATWFVRRVAVGAADNVSDIRLIPPLIAALTDTHHQIRGVARYSLLTVSKSVSRQWVTRGGDEASFHEHIMQPFFGAFQTLPEYTRPFVIDALHSFGALTVPHLLNALTDTHPNVRVSACIALGLAHTEHALPALHRIAETDEGITVEGAKVRNAAKRAIVLITKHKSNLNNPVGPA